MNREPGAFALTLWTASPALAAEADAAGVERIGLDLEKLGKRERQPGAELWLSDHDESQLPAIAAVLRGADLFVRSNPPHAEWPAEAERLLRAGAKVIMLPAFRHADDVRMALNTIAGRARLVPLVEMSQAIEDMQAIAAIGGLTEVHFGLNDLGLGWGLRNRFEALLHPRLEFACALLRDAGIRFGIGGIGRVDDDSLPIPSDLVYARYVALGSTAALLARSFHRGLAHDGSALAMAVVAARKRLAYWAGASASALEQQRTALRVALSEQATA